MTEDEWAIMVQDQLKQYRPLWEDAPESTPEPEPVDDGNPMPWGDA